MVVSAATLFLTLLYLDLITALRISCRLYRGPAGQFAEWIAVATVYLTAPLLILNGVRGVLVRSFPIVFLSVGLAAFGFWLLWFTFDRTFTYCWFDGADLPGCLFGCAH